VTTGTDATLPIMTVLEAHVPQERWEELVQLYDRGAGQLPAQMLRTLLAQEATDRTLWRGISVWRSRAALEEYRRSVTTPGGVAMFRAVGAEPVLSIWSVASSAPSA
jgi:quinol monooxygenase YgiN